MDHPVLVDIDVHLGEDILRVLEADRIEFAVAIWATFPDYFSPRLVFAADCIDRYSPRNPYEAFGKAIRGKLQNGSFPPLLLLKMDDPFIQDLRQTLGGLEGIEGMRLRGQSFGDRYLEDGYVYRVR